MDIERTKKPENVKPPWLIDLPKNLNQKLILVLLNMLPFFCFAQQNIFDKVYVVKQEEKNQAIEAFIEGISLRANQNIALTALENQKFIPLSQLNIEVDSHYWFRLALANTHLDTLQYILQIKHFAQGKMYVPKMQLIQESGVMCPVSRRANLASNIFHLKIPPQDTIQVFLHLSPHPRITPIYRFSLSEYTRWLELRLWELNSPYYFFQVFFQGAIWMFVLYNIFIFILLRDQSRLYYLLYMTSWGMYFLILKHRLPSWLEEYPVSLYFLRDTFSNVQFIFYLLFIRFFLNTKTDYPRWDFLFKILLYFICFLILLDWGLVYGMGLYYLPFNQFNNFSFLCFLLINLLFILRILKSLQDQAKLFFVLGNAFLFLGLIVAILLTLTFGQTTNLVETIVYLSILGEILFFSLALGAKQRMNEIAKQVAQEQLILELEKNRELQAQNNEKLEALVKQRTHELWESKQEILAQNEELHQQMELLRLANQKIVSLNLNLGKKVEEKTLHLQTQNEKLAEYAFYNAHKVRGPLARILGLVYIMQEETEMEQINSYLTLLSNATKDLDAKIKEINNIFE